MNEACDLKEKEELTVYGLFFLAQSAESNAKDVLYGITDTYDKVLYGEPVEKVPNADKEPVNVNSEWLYRFEDCLKDINKTLDAIREKNNLISQRIK